jgi:Ribosomal protein L10
MNRQEKQLVVDALKNDLSRSQAAFLVGVHGMAVSQVQALRKGLRKQGGTLKVAKNSLLRIAVQGVPGAQDLDPYFKDQIAVVFADRDATSVAKTIYDFSKENEKMTIVAGFFESQAISSDMVCFLGTLPPKEVLLAQMCGLLKAPIAKNVCLLNQLVARLLWVLKQASEQQQQ